MSTDDCYLFQLLLMLLLLLLLLDTDQCERLRDVAEVRKGPDDVWSTG
jgi:hypothetical protein